MPPRNARAHGAWAIAVRDKWGGWRADILLGSGSRGSSAHLAAGARARRGSEEEQSVEGTKRCWAGLPAADGGAVARGRASLLLLLACAGGARPG